MTDVEELRPLTAGELLTIRERTAGADWESEERALRRNAEVLARCCFREGQAVFSDGAAVLERLTAGERETLLAALLRGGGRLAPPAGNCNPAFDAARFSALREE